jgi:phage-related protein
MSFSKDFNYDRNQLTSSVNRTPTLPDEVTSTALSNVYGFCKLIEGYTGYCCAVRHATNRRAVNVEFSENNTIGLNSNVYNFNNGAASGTLEDFANGGDLEVIVLYDQLGSINATEPTGFDPGGTNRTGFHVRGFAYAGTLDMPESKIRSPILMKDGVLRTVSGLPSMLFTGSNNGATDNPGQTLLFNHNSDLRFPDYTENVHASNTSTLYKDTPIGITGHDGLEVFTVQSTTISAADNVHTDVILLQVSGRKAGPASSVESAYANIGASVGGHIFAYRRDFSLGVANGAPAVYSEQNNDDDINIMSGINQTITTGEQFILHGAHVYDPTATRPGLVGVAKNACRVEDQMFNIDGTGLKFIGVNDFGTTSTGTVPTWFQGSGIPLGDGHVQVYSIGQLAKFSTNSFCGEIQSVLVATGKLSSKTRDQIKRGLNDVYQIFQTGGTANGFSPTYGSSISFSSENSSWRGSDYNTFLMAQGLNNITANMNLNFVFNTDDTKNFLNYIQRVTTGVLTGQKAFDGDDMVINIGSDNQGFSINLDPSIYNNFSGSQVVSYNVKHLAHNVNQINLQLVNKRVSPFLENGQGFVKKVFNPSYIDGASFWLDASDSSTVLTSSSNTTTSPAFKKVTGFVDKIKGSTGIPIASSAVNVGYRLATDGNNNVNGLNTIYASGTKNGIEWPKVFNTNKTGFNINKTEFEMFALFRLDQAESQNISFWGDSAFHSEPDGPGGAMFLRRSNGKIAFTTHGHGGPDEANGSQTIETDVVIQTGRWFLIHGILSGDGQKQVRLNGGQQSLSDGVSGAVEVSNLLNGVEFPLGSGNKNFTIFDGPQGGWANDWNGSFAEGVVFDKTIKEEERQQMYEYFVNKWGTNDVVYKDDFANATMENAISANSPNNEIVAYGGILSTSNGENEFTEDGSLIMRIDSGNGVLHTAVGINFGNRFGTHTEPDTNDLKNGQHYVAAGDVRVLNPGESGWGGLQIDAGDGGLVKITGSEFTHFEYEFDNFTPPNNVAHRFLDVVVTSNALGNGFLNKGEVAVELKNFTINKVNDFASQGIGNQSFDVKRLQINSNEFDNYLYHTGTPGSIFEQSAPSLSFSGLSTYTGFVAGYTRTFFWKPDLSVDISIDNNARMNKFKGSFHELLNMSRNQNTIQSLNLTFSNRSNKEARSLLHFLETHMGYKSFVYNHNDNVLKGNKVFYCPKWDHTFNYIDSNTIKATFIEIPNPVTPNF